MPDASQPAGDMTEAMDRTLFTPITTRSASRFASSSIARSGRTRSAGAARARSIARSGASGRQGFLCPWLEAQYGGAGADFLCSVIVMEELARAYESGFAMSLPLRHRRALPVLVRHEDQKRRWLPGCASGDLVTALGMTEPGTGSDLAALTTMAVRDGDDYVINAKDVHLERPAVRHRGDRGQDRSGSGQRAQGISMFVIEAGRKGFAKGRRLHKMGMASQDTSELFFEDCRVPVANLLGPRVAAS